MKNHIGTLDNFPKKNQLLNQLLRKYKEFTPVYDGNLRHLTIAAVRGSGKTFAAIDSTVMFLLQAKANSSAAFFSKTLKQAKSSTFPVMKEILSHFPKKFWRYNATEGIYKFKISANDERKLYLLSYDTSDNARSYHPCIIVTDECAVMPYDMFGNVIYPMLNSAIADGWWRLTNIGTFRGNTNRFYELYLTIVISTTSKALLLLDKEVLCLCFL